MARNIVKDYIDYDKKCLREYINIITEKKLNSKISDMIIDTYIDIRYFDAYEHVKKHPIDNIEYYITNLFKSLFNDKNKKKNLPLIVDVLIILRYVVLYEKYSNNDKAAKQLVSYEDKVKDRYKNTKILVSDLIKSIKDNSRKKEKYLNNLLSNEFSIVKRNTNIKNVYDLFFDNCVKIPDLFSDIAINRVYNSGIIYEDKMTVFYILTEREILVDMVNYDFKNKYLVEFPCSLIGKRNKLSALLKLIDLDYLKERMVLKITYSEYLKNKEDFDKLIHDGYSLAVIIDTDVKDKKVLLNIFTYILIENENDKVGLEDFDNVILL